MQFLTADAAQVADGPAVALADSVVVVDQVAVEDSAGSAAAETLAVAAPAVVGDAVTRELVKISYITKETLCREVG